LLASVVCILSSDRYLHHRALHSFPTRRSSDLLLFDPRVPRGNKLVVGAITAYLVSPVGIAPKRLLGLKRVNELILPVIALDVLRSEEHTSELQSLAYLVCRLLLEKKNNINLTS